VCFMLISRGSQDSNLFKRQRFSQVKNALVFIGLDKVVFKGSAHGFHRVGQGCFQRISSWFSSGWTRLFSKDQLMVFIGLDKGTVKNRAQFSNKCSGLKLFIVYDNTKMVSISLTFKWFR